MDLKLRRSLAFIDLETTGINIVSDRIVEISILKISPAGTEEWFTTRVNPEMAIPPKSTNIHGIKDSDVAESPRFRDIAKKLAAFLEGCDLAGYNANKFDIPVLAEEFLRVNIDFDFRRRRYVDVQVIFHKKEQRTLRAAFQFYCKKELVGAHGAKADTQATYEILKAQLDRYRDLENDVEKLSDFSSYNTSADFVGRIIFDDDGREIFNFGKYKGKLVEQVLKDDPSYYSWMMNGDFSLYTKKILTEIKLREFGRK
ncbi:MAG TPA: 3'-5' exonuclease [Bacteroidales bacterium]|nr:3'-5' exonuclease [Bacteroidales bacterium]